jgi:transcriptional regulator with XRE-family HTH domain
MPSYERVVDRAARRANRFLLELGDEVRRGRRRAGISQTAIGRSAGISQSEIARIESGRSRALSIATAARVVAAVGLDLSVRAYPGGSPIRDVGQLKLLARLRGQVHSSLRWRTEVPIPIPGDQRAFDAVIDGGAVKVAVECVTRLEDVQAMERAINRKQLDAGIPCLILVLAATRHNRAALAAAPTLREAYPLTTRVILAGLRVGRLPSANGLVFL